jgi:hypothetical protein
MKKNLILYLIVCHVLMVCFFTSSCRPPTDRWPEQTAVYIYENKSGHSLQMQVYLKNKSDTLINIPNNDSFKETLKLSLFSSVGYDQFVSLMTINPFFIVQLKVIKMLFIQEK